MTDEVENVAKLDGPVWLVVQRGKMGPDLLNKLVLSGFSLERHEPPFATTKYEIWLLEPLTPASLGVD